MKKKNFIMIILFIFFFTFITIGLEPKSAEDVAIIAGTGVDIDKSAAQVIYNFYRDIYVFKENDPTSHMVLTGSASTIAQTRQERHVKSNKKEILGQEKIFLISDEYAEFGIKGLLDSFYKNPTTNNASYILICKGKSLPYLEHEIPGYPSSSDFMEGLVENSKEYNFFSENYNLMDLYIRSSAEGRTTALPYIELQESDENSKKKEIKIIGTAILKKDKLVATVDIEDSRIMNLLRENKVRGMLRIQEEPQKFIEYYGRSKRKVKCIKEGDKYKFIINLDIKGDIVSNELYKNIITDVKQKKDFEKKLAEKTEKMCNDFLDKMKKEYKADCLELGKVAAETYGRRTGIDWDKVVTDSIIEVNVKIKVDTQGRGDY
ncbi:Ger(x)C family spore germination protein [Clostridium sp. A1-XYC3]|uniref:Ger(X)C family spore germination protein n=1 Tax=Clostridium tanneri TaxID=3037988 RepID=A0ABU4JXD2_9CLOT|nr:Ger(x)C family spore germination protein [Clostridium sp. A1-XYC3]MDW8802815.1 Ger(x)C family spore germination protein [Clostridium sp. A1-XYC3]